MTAPALPSQAQPGLALAPGLERVRAADGRLVLVAGAVACDVPGDAEAVLELLDGTRELRALLVASAQLQPGRTPFQVLDLLARLEDRGLLTAGAVPATVEGSVWLRIRARFRLLSGRFSALPLPGVGLLALGRSVPAKAFDAVAVLAGLLALLAVGLALAWGQLATLLGPLYVAGGDMGPFGEVGRLLLCAVAIGSFRGIWRGLALHAHGTAAKPAVIWLGLPFIDVDPRARRAASMAGRQALARAGLGALAMAAGGSGLVWLATGEAWAHRTAAVGFMLLLLDTAPYLRSDAWHLLGLSVQLPGLGRRSASYVFRRLFTNFLRGAPTGAREGTYVAIGTCWVVHACAAVAVVGHAVLPSALARLSDVASGRAQSSAAVHGEPATAALVLVALLALLAALLLVALAGGLAFGVLGLAAQLARVVGILPGAKARRRPPDDADAAAFIEAARAIPFLAAAGEATLARAARALSIETWAPGATVLRQGEAGDRFCWIAAGRATVVLEEESGLEHAVASLGPGDFFGEVALVAKVPRTATVKAAADTALVLYALQGHDFLALVDVHAPSRDAVLEQIRNAAGLRSHPLVAHLGSAQLCRLLGSVRVERAAPGQMLVRQGEAADDLFIVREGLCSVHVEEGAWAEVSDDSGPVNVAVRGSREVARLGSGAWFGEVALLRGGARTASVKAEVASVLLRVPGAEVTEVLLADLRAATTLQRVASERKRSLDLSTADGADFVTTAGMGCAKQDVANLGAAGAPGAEG